jgi:hypothetical protein
LFGRPAQPQGIDGPCYFVESITDGLYQSLNSCGYGGDGQLSLDWLRTLVARGR